MTDVWATFTDLDATTQERLASVLETRGSDPRQQAIRRAFLGTVDLPADSQVLEVGCGTGVLTRTLAGWQGVASVVGVDIADSLLDRARLLTDGLPNVTFRQADARSLPFEEATFDAVVFDSTLTHVPRPESALAEAFRVLRPDGVLGVFDGDYATTTVALCDHDPLQNCVDAMMAASVTDRWFARRLPALVRDCGFATTSFASHGYVETSAAGYMLTIVDRGADILSAQGKIDEAAASALKDEARRRVERGSFFGHIAFVSLTARKPASPLSRLTGLAFAGGLA
jgi:ubiquinone/menaquinone biosynthesis C-methylase UbiE